MSDEITRDEFIRRFTEEMVRRVGETDANGESVRDYAAQAAPAYFDDASLAPEGPEACVEADLDCWEHVGHE